MQTRNMHNHKRQKSHFTELYVEESALPQKLQTIRETHKEKKRAEKDDQKVRKL